MISTDTAKYPVLEVLPQLLDLLNKHNVVVLEAPTGAGKSTSLPLHLLGHQQFAAGKIIMLEPRRLAARAVARRLAQQLGEEVGQTVGYSVRFERKISAKTRLEVVTEGILTRMLQQDNSLEEYGLVIFDEFHERSLESDTALALVRDMQAILRPDIKVLIMSATLNTAKLSEALAAPVVKSLGRQFPVEITYQEPDRELKLPNQLARAVLQELKKSAGDILVFLPGVGEINQTYDLLEATVNEEVKLYKLYGDLSAAEQDAALLPSKNGYQKVILATSIAETSLTIEGITTVIDSGLCRRPVYNPKNGLSSLKTVAVSQAMAAQRAGRAGRLGPGKAIRLWSRGAHTKLPEAFSPDILEADLTAFVLNLAEWGSQADDLLWIDAPPSGNVKGAQQLLYSLEALNDQNKITEEGRRLARFAAHPRIAHMLSNSIALGSASLAADVAALLEERDPFGRNENADFSLRIEALVRCRNTNRGWTSGLKRVDKLASQWCQRLSAKPLRAQVHEEEIGRLIALAYPERIAKAEKAGVSNRYRLASGQWAALPEADNLFLHQWLAIAAYDAGTSNGKIFLAAPIAEEMVEAKSTREERVYWSAQEKKVKAETYSRIGVLTFNEKPESGISQEQAQAVLLDLFRKEGLRLFAFNESIQQWLNKIAFAAKQFPELDLPGFSEESLKQEAGSWLVPYLNNIRKEYDLKQLNLADMLKARLSYAQLQQLEKLFPDTITVPTGSVVRLNYDAVEPPILAVRLQELFGLAATPTINNGSIPVKLHLLSPGYKPIQVTQDLTSFWNTTYAEVRKELRGRYPKHHWPEDPWKAEAVRGVKRKAK